MKKVFAVVLIAWIVCASPCRSDGPDVPSEPAWEVRPLPIPRLAETKAETMQTGRLTPRDQPSPCTEEVRKIDREK